MFPRFGGPQTLRTVAAKSQAQSKIAVECRFETGPPGLQELAGKKSGVWFLSMRR